ncbi:hypothetical protein RI129_011761 [Pyrocoelia pectoralis]|uniref:Cytochrome P450 n=1 Tax=Pyrocoelia pectoralis TaxID=417401 RepID=A0AAN7V8I6_9COLE
MCFLLIGLGLLIIVLFAKWRQENLEYIELINKIPGPPTDFLILLSSKNNLKKSKVYEFLQVWLGTGLLTSKGAKWHYRRKLLTPAFHFGILQQFSKVMFDEADVLVSKLEKECHKAMTSIELFLGDFTLRTICETAMGTRLQKNDERSKEYITAIYKMGQVIVDRIKRPWLFIEFLYYFSELRRQENKLIQILHSFTIDVIEKRKLDFNKDVYIQPKGSKSESKEPKKRLALLDLLLNFKNQGADIGDEGIREEVDTFTFEGHETTSTSIQFALLLLANNPNIQEKVAEEIHSLVGNSNRQFTYSDIQEMRYLEMTIKESLRLFPGVPIIARMLTSDLMTASKYFIPKDTVVHVQIYALHRNPIIYPDPEKFDPERFSPENSRGRHPFAYIPFSAGPRNCIGQRFAMLELKIAIASILRNFRVLPVDTPSDLKLMMHLVLKNSKPLSVQFRKRIYPQL